MDIELKSLINAVETADSLEFLRDSLIALNLAVKQLGEDDRIETILAEIEIPTFSYSVADVGVDAFLDDYDFRVWSHSNSHALVGSSLEANELQIVSFYDMVKKRLYELVEAAKAATSLQDLRYALIDLAAAYGMANAEGHCGVLTLENLLPVDDIPTFGNHPALPGNYTQQIWSYSGEQGLVGWSWNEEELKIIDWCDVID